MGASAVTLKFLLLGDDKLSSHFTHAGDAAEKAEKKVGRMSHAMTGMKIAGAAAGAGLLGLFKVGFDEASDAAAGTAQLAAGIKSTGNAANVTVDGLNNLAGSIQSYSGQTDDSIVASEKLLLTFTGIHNAAGKNNDIFNQATKATADMAAKMGGDASKYAVQLGKALNDPIKGVTALTKIGVSFTASQKEQIGAMVKSGDTMGAQKIILGELHKEFGGSAEAAGKTLPGQLARARRAFEDVAQSVVQKLMPIIMALANFLLTKVLPVFKAVTDFIMNHKQAFTILAIIIGTVVVGLRLWAIAQAILNVIMSANPIALVVIAIAALAAGLIYAYKHSETFRNIVQKVWGVIKTVIMGVWNFYLKPMFAAWKKAFEVVAAVAKWVGDAIGKVFGFIKDHWGIMFAVLTGGMSLIIQHWREVKGAFVAAWGIIRDNVFKPIVAVFTWVWKQIQKVGGWIGKAFDAVGSALRSVYDHTIGPILHTISSAIDTITSALSNLTGGVGQKKNKDGSVTVTLGGSTVGTYDPKTGKPKAGGGRVYAGMPYLVGEERAEMFVPDQNGTIVPRLMNNGPASMKVDMHTTGLEREIRRLGDRIEGMQVKLDGYAVGTVVGRQADRMGRAH